MTEVLADYHLARAMANTLNSDQRYKAPLIMDGVFQKHGITKAIFDSSMIWYTRNPQDLAIIYNRVNTLLQERIKESDATNLENSLHKQTASYSDAYPSKDSINLWRGPSLLHMNRMLSTRREQFVIPTDSTFYPTDIIEWSLHTQMLPQSRNAGKAIMYLMARYSPDSVIVSSRIIRESGTYKLTVRNNSGREMRQIWGFIQYFPGEKVTDAQNRILIDHIRLMRYHAKKESNKKEETNKKEEQSHPSDSSQTIHSNDVQLGKISVDKTEKKEETEKAAVTLEPVHIIEKK